LYNKKIVLSLCQIKIIMDKLQDLSDFLEIQIQKLESIKNNFKINELLNQNKIDEI
jgi:hypothetical protein